MEIEQAFSLFPQPSENQLVNLSQPMTRCNRIECKPELVIAKLQKFYSSSPAIQHLMPYLTGSAPISLRVIDWFVTKEARKNFTQYILNGQKFIVFLSYKSQLRAYSKKYFDPNCRRERIMFEIPGQEPFLTTIGKLNFFRWASECNVLQYIEDNIEEIRQGYNDFLKENGAYLKKLSNSTESSTDSQTSTLSIVSAISTGLESLSSQGSTQTRQTRRRRSKQIPSALQKLQIQNNGPVILEFK
jgi:hypothetical protein